MGFIPISDEISEAEERLGKNRDAFVLLIGAKWILHRACVYFTSRIVIRQEKCWKSKRFYNGTYSGIMKGF
jgi:hypothetical protein